MYAVENKTRMLEWRSFYCSVFIVETIKNSCCFSQLDTINALTPFKSHFKTLSNPMKNPSNTHETFIILMELISTPIKTAITDSFKWQAAIQKTLPVTMLVMWYDFITPCYSLSLLSFPFSSREKSTQDSQKSFCLAKNKRKILLFGISSFAFWII
jgi:hypothetical protein